MKLQKVAGATSEIWQVFIADSSSTTGAGLAALVFNSAGLTAYYHRDTDTTATVITLVTMTVGTFTSSGFKEIDATNMPGWYQFCPPNAAVAAGAKSCAFHLKGATNMAPLPIEVQLVAYNPDTATNLGLSALPTAAPGAANGVLIAGTNAPVTITGSGDALTLLSTAANGVGLRATGQGTGHGIAALSGTGATGDGIRATSQATDGQGLSAVGSGSGIGILGTAGATGVGIRGTGGATSGAGIAAQAVAGNSLGLSVSGFGTGSGFRATGGANGAGIGVIGGATAGNGIDITTTSGHGINLAPVGTNAHGILATGGNGGVSDGIKAAAGTGGVDIRGNITGTITTATNLTTNNDKTGYGLTASERNSTADAVLDRDMSTGTDSGSATVRTPRQALRMLRNKVDASASPATIYKEDDTTASWTTVLTTSAGAAPIVTSDPAGP